MSARDTIKNGISWGTQDGRLHRPLWKGTKTGVFTVHSAYEMLESDRRKSDIGESSNMANLRWLWRKVWKMAIPGKIKHFIWRAYHESLPTYQQLHRRKIRTEANCPVCSQQEETTLHALWQCPLARNTWALVQGRVQKLPNQGGDFSIFMLRMFQDFPKAEIEEWAITSWAILRGPMECSESSGS
uniref:Reverse transcriptase zinc-binding domain-containing protein n=1 Tax=Fagus sylvatica TaxID=28930 RepID=A0A2N9FCX4_FAGSY